MGWALYRTCPFIARMTSDKGDFQPFFFFFAKLLYEHKKANSQSAYICLRSLFLGTEGPSSGQQGYLHKDKAEVVSLEVLTTRNVILFLLTMRVWILF